MKIITGATGEAHVTSNDDGEFNQGLHGDDLVVLNVGNKLSAEIVDNNTVRISDGDLVMQGRHALVEPGTTEDIAITSGTIGYKRNDLIVVRYEMDTQTGYESMSFAVIQGTETSGTASDPEYTEGDIRTGSTVAELPLYRVSIDSDASISAVTFLKKYEPMLSHIGTTKFATKDNLKTGSDIDVATQGATVTLNAGTWVICAQWVFRTRSSSAGSVSHQVGICNVTGNYNEVTHRDMSPTYGYATLTTSTVVVLTGETVFSCNGSCSAANASQTDSSIIKAVRIC